MIAISFVASAISSSSLDAHSPSPSKQKYSRPTQAIAGSGTISGDQQDDQIDLGMVVGDRLGDILRSEEHTSELQSLMRISYAVFCLKKKKHIISTLTKTSAHEHSPRHRKNN